MVGFLIKHSLIFRRGDTKDQTIQHGQRVFCSNRHNQSGCGHTFAFNLTIKLPRLHRFTKQINQFFLHYIISLCTCFSWHATHPACYDITAPYRFLKLVRKAFVNLRPLLCNLSKPPDEFSRNIPLHLFSHIKNTFSENDNCLEAFILHFEQRVF